MALTKVHIIQVLIKSQMKLYFYELFCGVGLEGLRHIFDVPNMRTMKLNAKSINSH